MALNIEVMENDLSLIKRIKQSLIKKFNPTSEKDIEKLIELANYLVALHEFEQSRQLLESGVYLEQSQRPEELWVTNAQGVVLLAYLSRVTGSSELYEKYISILVNNDMWPLDISRSKWIKMHISDHDKKVAYALTENQKNKCAIIGQEVLSFMYFNEIVFEYEKPSILSKMALKDVKKILADSQKLLVDVLQS